MTGHWRRNQSRQPWMLAKRVAKCPDQADLEAVQKSNCVVASYLTCFVRVPPCAWQGLVVSPDDLLEHGLTQGEFCHQLLQPGVLRFNFLEFPGLVYQIGRASCRERV